ncbi:MAG: ribonuclease Z [Planctomycetes bacterium]|nr:ribonuclease Z [Planctomycetota bacterium]
MSITFEILGSPGRDNALLVRVDSGQSVTRLLFDCGDGCLNTVSFAEILATDHLFLSHLHMDHVGGFDYLFRCLFNRDTRPNHIWGPIGTTEIIHHRFQGFLWNLHAGMSGTWLVHDVSHTDVSTSRFELCEAFAIKHDEGTSERNAQLVDLGTCTVDVHVMNHGTPSLAYVVREKARSNVDTSQLAVLGLRPGPWLKQLKDNADRSDDVVIDGVPHSMATLRESLVTETPGDSIAYLTDFILDEAAVSYLSKTLQNCGTVVCEAQYRNADRELALRNFHMTTGPVAELARQSDINRLVLFHLSDRYTSKEWSEMLAEARAIFPNTAFPEAWHIESIGEQGGQPERLAIR